MKNNALIAVRLARIDSDDPSHAIYLIIFFAVQGKWVGKFTDYKLITRAIDNARIISQ